MDRAPSHAFLLLCVYTDEEESMILTIYLHLVARPVVGGVLFYAL
jgi:hypothetical protein